MPFAHFTLFGDLASRYGWEREALGGHDRAKHLVCLNPAKSAAVGDEAFQNRGAERGP